MKSLLHSKILRLLWAIGLCGLYCFPGSKAWAQQNCENEGQLAHRAAILGARAGQDTQIMLEKVMDLVDSGHLSLPEEIQFHQSTIHDRTSYQGQIMLRAITMTAGNMLDMGMDVEAAKTLILATLEVQGKEPGTLCYGCFPWAVNPESNDRNAVEFIMLSVGSILAHHHNQLGQTFLTRIRPNLEAALTCIKMQNLSVEYTNIYTMRISNLLLLGEHLQDQQAIDLAQHCLDKWLGYVAHYGVYEYINPTYTPLSIYCLATAHGGTKNLEMKAKLERGIRFLWASIAANAFAPAQGRLGGAHSRCYDLLFGKGSVCYDLYLYGLGPADFGNYTYMSDTKTISNFLSGGFQPDQTLLDLNQQYPRVIKERFGPRSGQDRYHYVTEDFSIGSSSYYYCSYDRQVNVLLGGDKLLPMMFVMLDPFDAPYGQRVKGFSRPFHLPNHSAAVQEKGTLMALIRAEPHLVPLKYDSIGTNVILPMDVDELWLDGKRLPTQDAFDIPAAPDSVVTVRQGQALVNIKFLHADSVHGYRPDYYVKYDGNEDKAGRLVVYHYRGDDVTADQPFYVALLIDAQQCASPTQARQITQQFTDSQAHIRRDGKTLAMAVDCSGARLEAALSTDDGQLVYRRINGKDYSPDTFSINGADYAREYLGAYLDDFAMTPEPVRRTRQAELLNSGFEQGQAHWFWKYDPHGMARVCAEAAHTGQMGLRLTDRSEVHAGKLLGSTRPCTPGQRYELRFKYRVLHSNEARTGATVAVEFLNQDGRPMNVAKMRHPEWYHVTLSPTTGWWEDSLRVTALPEAVSMRVTIYSNRAATCVADFDEFELAEIDH